MLNGPSDALVAKSKVSRFGRVASHSAPDPIFQVTPGACALNGIGNARILEFQGVEGGAGREAPRKKVERGINNMDRFGSRHAHQAKLGGGGGQGLARGGIVDRRGCCW